MFCDNINTVYFKKNKCTIFEIDEVLFIGGSSRILDLLLKINTAYCYSTGKLLLIFKVIMLRLVMKYYFDGRLADNWVHLKNLVELKI